MDQFVLPPPECIAVIGECVVITGPEFEGHFVSIVTFDGNVMDIPYPDARAVLERLSKAFHVDLDQPWRPVPNYGNCSRILHPPELAEKPLWVFRGPTISLTGAFWFLISLGSYNQRNMRISPEVAEYLNAKRAGR